MNAPPVAARRWYRVVVTNPRKIALLQDGSASSAEAQRLLGEGFILVIRRPSDRDAARSIEGDSWPQHDLEEKQQHDDRDERAA